MSVIAMFQQLSRSQVHAALLLPSLSRDDLEHGPAPWDTRGGLAFKIAALKSRSIQIARRIGGQSCDRARSVRAAREAMKLFLFASYVQLENDPVRSVAVIVVVDPTEVGRTVEVPGRIADERRARSARDK